MTAIWDWIRALGTIMWWLSATFMFMFWLLWASQRIVVTCDYAEAKLLSDMSIIYEQKDDMLICYVTVSMNHSVWFDDKPETPVKNPYAV